MQNGLRTYRPNLSQYTYCSDHTEREIQQWLNCVQAGTVTRALLITGPTGLGKTTLALALSDSLGVDPQNIRQINCGDLRTLEDARDLINSSLMFGPSRGAYRVLVLDECHQMVKNAQKAFLTPLEQLDNKIIVIGCTSNPELLEAPFRGRFYQIALDDYSEDSLVDILMNLPEQPDPEKAVLAARAANGNPRAAIAMIEKGVTEQDAQEIKAEQLRIEHFVAAMATGNAGRALQVVGALRSDQTVRFVSESCYLIEQAWLRMRGHKLMMPTHVKKFFDEDIDLGGAPDFWWSGSDMAWLYNELQRKAFSHPNEFKGLVMAYFERLTPFERLRRAVEQTKKPD